VSDDTPPAGLPSPTPEAGGDGRRRGWLIGAGLTAVAVTAGALLLAVSGRDNDEDDPDGGAPTTELPAEAPPGSGAEVSRSEFARSELSLPDFSLPALTAPVTTLEEGAVPPAEDEPDGLGSDAELDELAEECFDGEMQSCDDLYTRSPRDSDYEEYGDTCAGRQPPNTRRYCSDVFTGG
jgi:hypothetical protein